MTTHARQTSNAAPMELQLFLLSFVRRNRLIFLGRRLASAIGMVCVWLIVASLVDRVEPVAWGIRVVVEAAVAACVAVLLLPSIVRLFRRNNVLTAAAQVDAIEPRFNGILETIVSQTSRPSAQQGSAALTSVLIRRAFDLIPTIDIRSLVPLNPLRRPTIAASLLIGTVSILMSVERLKMPSLFERQLCSWVDLPAITYTSIQVMPGSVTRRAGRAFTVVAHVVDPAMPTPLLEYRVGKSDVQSMPMALSGGDYEFRFSSLDQPLQYRVSAGDAVSPLYTVDLDRAAQNAGQHANRSGSKSSATMPTDRSPAEDAYLRFITAPDARIRSTSSTEPLRGR